MAVVLYVSSVEPGSGKSLVSLGLMELASRRTSKLGYFRPVVNPGADPDPMINLMRGRYSLAQSYSESYGVEADAAWAAGETPDEVVVNSIISAFERLAARCNVVVVEGADFAGPSTTFEFGFNAAIAAHIGASAVVVIRASGRRAEQVRRTLEAAGASYAEHHVPIISFTVNRVEPSSREEFESIGRELDGVPVWLLPEEPELAEPTLADVVSAVGARIIDPGAGGLSRAVRQSLVAAMGLTHLVEHLRPQSLLIVPGDRSDVILMALASQFGSGIPAVAGLLLTGGIDPDQSLIGFADGLDRQAVAILGTDLLTMETAEKITHIVTSIAKGDMRRVALALRTFDDNVDATRLGERVLGTRSTTLTPVMFEHRLVEKVRDDPKHIVLPEGEDDRVLAAADRLLRGDAARLTILGDTEQIKARAEALGLDLAGATVIDPLTSPWLPEFTRRLLEARRHKGMSETTASDLVRSPTWFGTLMVDTGRADGMVSGACHTTADTVRPALQVIRTAPGTSVVSSVFLMALEDKVLVYGDCAVVPDPDASELADIALSSAATARAFGIEPYVAMLSYSTGASGKGADVEKVAAATALVRERDPALAVDGPIQYDAAVDPKVAALKAPGSPVAGRATVLVFPDLNTGNNTYKAVQRSAGAVAMGPILQGLRLPVNDLSRGATVDDIVHTVVITEIQAQHSGRAEP